MSLQVWRGPWGTTSCRVLVAEWYGLSQDVVRWNLSPSNINPSVVVLKDIYYERNWMLWSRHTIMEFPMSKSIQRSKCVGYLYLTNSLKFEFSVYLGRILFNLWVYLVLDISLRQHKRKGINKTISISGFYMSNYEIIFRGVGLIDFGIGYFSGFCP